VNLSDVKIQWIWPGRQAGEPNIGFGVHATRFVWGLAASAAFILVFVLLLVLDAPSEALLGIGVVSVGVAVAMFAASRQHYRFYEVDQVSRPISPLDSTPPPEVMGRRPMSKRRFLASGGTSRPA
jgi:hypothetical protein